MSTISNTLLVVVQRHREIEQLLAAEKVDFCAIDSLIGANQRDLSRARSAHHIIHAAPRISRVDQVLNQFVPRAFAR